MEKLQRLTAAGGQKMDEDTRNYRGTWMGAIEVGHEQRPVSLEEFHRRVNAVGAYDTTALSTHDSKLSEVVRARLVALTQVPDLWNDYMKAWRAIVPSPHTLDATDTRAHPADATGRLAGLRIAWSSAAGSPGSDGFAAQGLHGQGDQGG